MCKRVIRRDQPIVKKKMDYFKMEIASMALPILSQTPLWHGYIDDASFRLRGYWQVKSAASFLAKE